MKINWSKKTIYAAILLAFLSGCNKDEANYLLQDSISFCEIHEEKYWQDISPELPIDEFESIVLDRTKGVLKTQRFKGLVDELSEVQFYRQMYPTAKKKISQLIGAEWNCPAYEKFYALKVRPTDDSIATSQSPQPEITIKNTGEFYLLQNKLNIESDQLEKFFDERGIDKTLIVLLEPGASDAALQPLFKKLAALGISDVSVISE